MGCKKLYHMLKPDIAKLDVTMGRDKFFDLLRDWGLLVKRRRKYVVTTKSFYRYSQYEDHFNGREWYKPHQAWVSDITYIRVGENFRYLFLITDAYSRKIVGWYLGNSLESKWAVEALNMAIAQCPDPKGVVHHSDRGFQYCSKAYTKVLKGAGIISSMGEAGNCYDNAMAERINGILKNEYLLDEKFRNLKEAFKTIRQAIDQYNYVRPHMSLALMRPAEIHRGLPLFSSIKRKGSSKREPVKAK
jgi:putative transposase